MYRSFLRLQNYAKSLVNFDTIIADIVRKFTYHRIVGYKKRLL